MPRLEHCSTQTEALTWLKLDFNFILSQYLVAELYIYATITFYLNYRGIYVTGKN